MIYGIYGHMMCGNVWKIYMGISSEYGAYHIHYHYSQELHKGLWPYNLWKSVI